MMFSVLYDTWTFCSCICYVFWWDNTKFSHSVVNHENGFISNICRDAESNMLLGPGKVEAPSKHSTCLKHTSCLLEIDKC